MRDVHVAAGALLVGIAALTGRVIASAGNALEVIIVVVFWTVVGVMVGRPGAGGGDTS